jgi:hypothetical protein
MLRWCCRHGRGKTCEYLVVIAGPSVEAWSEWALYGKLFIYGTVLLESELHAICKQLLGVGGRRGGGRERISFIVIRSLV